MIFPELVIFDCDGVLIDSEATVNQAVVEVLAELGINMSCEEALERYAGRAAGYEKNDIEARYQIKLPTDFFERKRERVTQLFNTSLKPITGVHNLVAALPFEKCVASGSTLWRLRHALGLVGLWDYFAPDVFSSEQVQNGKPAPDVYLFAAAQMGVDPAACLVIEDSVVGVRAGKAANMRVFGFTGGSHCRNGHADVLRREGADEVFADMGSLAQVLLPSSSDILTARALP